MIQSREPKGVEILHFFSSDDDIRDGKGQGMSHME
jgi:hypothetical protein